MPDISLQQLLTTNFSQSPSGYTGSQGAIGYTGSAGSSSDIPKITNIEVTDSSYAVLDDTAVDIAGGYIKITGTGFASGCQITIGTAAATSTTFVSATEVRAQMPATAAGTYIVYLVNTDGGVAIRVNGVTFSTTPNWVTGGTLPTTDSGSAISIQLSASGATTYSLQAGSSLPTGLTLSNAGLLSGTVSGLLNETTYNFTIVATDGELQDSPRTFTITITAGDQYWKSVTTLLSPTLAALPFNDDASANNFAVAVNGDTKPNNFNPYTPGYYSSYFDGSGDYLRVSSTGAGFSSITTFTYECWIYPTASLSTNCIFDISECQPFRFVLSGSNVTWQATGAGSTILTATFTWVIGAWHHVAFVRDSSNNIAIFINGTRYATGTYSSWGSTGTGGVNIGCNRGDTWFFPGYISNARFVKDVAVYDPTATTLTVPSVPLTAVAGTSLLACSSNRFVDASANNLAITPNGDTRISGFDPFTPNSSYSTYGSTYFDGTGDYFSLVSNDAFNCGTGDFTLETWYYHDGGTALYPSIFSSTDWATGTGGVGLRFNNTTLANKFAFFWYGVGDPFLTASFTSAPYAWHHVAVTRSGNTFTLWVDGVSAATGTASGTVNFNLSTGGPRLGWGPWDGSNGYLKAYLSNLRLIKGTALYTTNFTPPTEPLTSVSGTSLLTCQSNQPVNNNVFLDSSTNNFLVTRNGNATQGTFSPYGENWSNYFDGNGDYIDAGGSGYNLSANWTIECWFYSTAGGIVFDCRPNAVNGFYAEIAVISNTQLDFYYNANGNTLTVSNALNAWNHVAVVRNSGTLKVYYNGTSVYSVSDSNTWGIPANRPRLGANGGFLGAAPGYYTGYVSNLRIVNGTAVYTANFTPGTTPLQPIAGTTLLTCRGYNFVDNSPNNYTITRNGDVSVQKFGPFAGTTLPDPVYSAYFDGSGDALSSPTTGDLFNFGTGDFCVEAFVNLNSTAEQYVVGTYDGGNGGWSMYLPPTGSTLSFRNGDASQISRTFSFAVSTWYHIAVSRSSSTLRFFVNGTQVGADQTSYTQNISRNNTNGCAIGRYLLSDNQNGGYVNGYISNVRVVKGTAVYTANFTTPTSPLTAISGTSLLTCQSATFIDNSTNNFAITAAGNARPSTVAPFTATYSTKQSYTPSVFGGSMYFGANSAYALVAMNGGDSFGTGDFTVEAWLYPLNSAINISYPNANTNTWGMITYANQLYWQENGGNLGGAGYGTVTQAGWNHLAVCRSGSTIRWFVNGIQVNSASNTFNYSGAPTNRSIGPRDGGGAPGYISDFRVVKGTALYTGSFVPQNQPLTPIRNSVLLLSNTGAGIYDSSEINALETVADTKLSTSTVKFAGTTSIYFDGTGDNVKSVKIGANTFRTGNFTIEMWVYPQSATGYQCMIQIGSTNPYIFLGINTGSTGTPFMWNDGNVIVGSQNFTLNTWQHWAIVRNNGTVTMYLNGTSIGSASFAGDLVDNTGVYLGSNSGGTQQYVGYMSDVRITTGVARYTSNFTAPTGAFMAK